MDRIGRYRLTQRIGAGSFATVYKGHDDDLDVPVAIKVLSANWAQNADVRRRFVAEARLLRRIRDERIVRVYDIGDTPDGLPYFVMDYADGGTMDNLRKHLTTPGRALRLCAEASRALEVLHRHNQIHRDVTPGNVLLTHSAAGVRVMLADLGVSESLVDKFGASTTAGTPAFMAIEQATGAPLDHRSDIYSMAAVTYSLLTGHAPFPIRTLEDLLGRNPAIGPPPVSDRIGAPLELDALLADALSPDPSRRPQSAEQFATALDAIADLMPGGDTYVPLPLEGGGRGATLPPTTAGHAVPNAPLPSSDGDWASSSHRSFRSVDDLNTVAPRNETPASMLEQYLGRGRYQPAPVKERHSWGYYATIAGILVVVFVIVLFLTITYLT
ncbi:serine/threonine-protein kinase [Aestuariimicrobium soli]|uniref:serine/threonine-protein kinase n=1 Tax=Aestuariimicrobium soli TaxID=2035834 RepID=UPI003EBB502B